VTYALVVLGALVRANHAGLACPDWPLCFGQVVPEIDLRVGFEFGHRVLASAVSLGFLVGAIAVFRNPAARARVGPWIGVAGVLLALQIVLGGLTVLHLLASWTVTSHLLTGNAFALVLALTAHRLLARGDAVETPVAVRVVLALTAAVLGVQLTLGGLVSSTYSGLVCPDWPSCVNGVWVPTWTGPQGLQVIHRLNAYLLVGLVVTSFVLARRRAAAPLSRLLAVAVCLVLAQTAVGVANVLLRLPVEITGAHSALAAALCLTIGLGVHDAFTGVRVEAR
jgi:heme A synthase